LDGEAGYDPGKLIERNEFELDQAEARKIDDLLENLQLFSVSTNEKPDRLGLDGDMWVLEGTVNGRYHIVHRWCPAIGDVNKRGLEPLVRLASFLFEVSELSERPNAPETFDDLAF